MKKMLDFYLINENTLAIIPYKNKSKVIEKYITYVVNLLPTEIVNNSCLYYGSSYKGRSESSSYFLGTKYKNPIIISENNRVIMFPTTSPNNVDCLWINYKGISKYYSHNLSTTKIELINNKILTINLSNRIFGNQVLKSSRLDLIIGKK